MNDKIITSLEREIHNNLVITVSKSTLEKDFNISILDNHFHLNTFWNRGYQKARRRLKH